MERLADGSAAWTFPVRCSMGLFRSYEVEWETCRVELQFGVFFSPAQENKRLGLFSPLQFGLFQSSAVWTFFLQSYE